MKKSAFISDVIFAFFTSFLFCLCLFRYYGVTLFFAIALSALCAGLTACAIFALLRSKRKKFFLKKSDENQKEKLLFHLALASDEHNTEFFRCFLSSFSPTAKQGKLRIANENETYFLRFHLSPVSPDEVVRIFHTKTAKQKVLLCAQIDETALALCSRFDITVKTGAEVYTLLKENDSLPEKYLGDETPEKKRKRRAKLWFSKTNSRRFLVGGGILLSTSLLTPFPYYYLLFGALLLLAAVLVRIFGYD